MSDGSLKELEYWSAYSLIMTLYEGSKTNEFREALQSMLEQTVPPAEVVVVEDGSVPTEIEELLKSLEKMTEPPFFVVSLDKNVGPAIAANYGIDACEFDLIARLDSDDVAHSDRMEKQLKFLKDNPEYKAVGSLVKEFDPLTGQTFRVDLPETHDEISGFARRRCPCRQSTLLYRKAALQEIGFYRDLRFAEEWDLFNRFIEAGFLCHNLQEVLVDMRIGSDYFSRRGGRAVFKRVMAFKRSMLREGKMGIFDFLVSGGSSVLVCLMPNRLRTWVYQNFLRGTENTY